jgi:aminoglycoside phosphotransferase (APT) family kinase protein
MLLHKRLHAITTADGRVLVHGDLHWKKLIEASSGPVVIDWANAGGGDPALDTALTWIVLATSSRRLGRALADRFAHIVDVQTGRDAAARRRLTDANLTLAERQAGTKLLH